MNWIDHSALKIAKKIRNNYEEASSENVLFYALSLLINTITAILLILLISFITGNQLEALISIFSFLMLRSVSGGFHLNSSLTCCVFSVILITLLSFVEFNFILIGIAFNIAATAIAFYKAPTGIEKVSRIAPKYYKFLKIITIAIIASNFIIQSSLLASIFFAQMLTLTNIGYAIAKKIDGGE